MVGGPRPQALLPLPPTLELANALISSPFLEFQSTATRRKGYPLTAPVPTPFPRHSF